MVRALTQLRRAGQTRPVTEWIYFIHPPRDDFAATMTAEEETVWAGHFQRLKGLLASGQLILAGPTLGTANTGLVIFDAPDEQGRATGHGGRPGGPRRLRTRGDPPVPGIAAARARLTGAAGRRLAR